jgi:ribose 5-phosphate isomerase B
MCIAANKIRGIRAALCHDAFAAQRARQHNDANILCLRAEDINTELALEIVKVFLATDFEGGRHVRRVNKIKALEEGNNGKLTSS